MRRQSVLFTCLVGILFHAAAALAEPPAQARPRIGVALGGGSARGLAHVGVLRWLEEHRIPIDVVGGTSMGGLIGGSYTTGMTPDEIEAMLAGIDWDAMFGGSNFAQANVRRKRDLRAYPSHLEFGLRRGIVPPTALNNGQQVDLLLARIAASYYGITSFDELPTPFRCVAVDLKTARFIVLDRGSLAHAMRATMSLPLIFPPVSVNDQVLVDGGAMNNIPADVVRDMGADRVIAVNVGDLTDPSEISATMLGLAGSTLDAMMRANTLKAIKSADVLINVPVKQFGSLAWRQYDELIKAGYAGAESMKAELLPLAVDDAIWEAWRSARAARRRTALPMVSFLQIEGAGSADTALMERKLAVHLGRTLDISALETSLAELGGLDRYQSLMWQITARAGAEGLLVRAHPKTYGPPFVFLGISLENTTSNDFRFGLDGRYLAYDVIGSGSELRFDAGIGSDPSVAIALYRPVGRTAVFVEPFAGAGRTTLNVIQEDAIVAAYSQTRSVIGGDIGINVGRLDEVRAGVVFGRLDASVQIGDPGLPELSGKEAWFRLRWTHDNQDSPVVPSTGVHAETTLEHILDSPPAPATVTTTRTSEGVTQLAGTGSWFQSLNRHKSGRVFLAGGAGTSFNGHPLAIHQFPIGGPLRLSAFNVAERRGDHFVLATGGYLHQIGRLPDFIGQSVFLGAWLEGGSAFDHLDDADFASHVGLGLIGDTLIGPVFTAFGLGFDGAFRFYVGIGRIF